MTEEASDLGLYDYLPPDYAIGAEGGAAPAGQRRRLNHGEVHSGPRRVRPALIALADTLLRVAERGLYRPLWSQRILDETTDAILEIHPDLTPPDVARRINDMNRSFEDALVEGWEDMESSPRSPTLTTATSSLRRSEAGRTRSSRPTRRLPRGRPGAARNRGTTPTDSSSTNSTWLQESYSKSSESRPPTLDGRRSPRPTSSPGSHAAACRRSPKTSAG